MNGITDIQSYSLVIRDVFFDVLAADPFFVNYTRRKSKMLQVQSEHLPYLGVYIVDEQMLPDGDANAGCIRFLHTLRIGFSVMHAHNDPTVAEASADAAYWHIMQRLWTDQYVMNLIDTRVYPSGIGNPDNTRIEGVTRGTRRHVFGNAQSNNETPIVEAQYEASCSYRTTWEPEITDTLDEIHLRTGIKIGESEDEMAQREQVNAVYVFGSVPHGHAHARGIARGVSQ